MTGSIVQISASQTKNFLRFAWIKPRWLFQDGRPAICSPIARSFLQSSVSLNGKWLPDEIILASVSGEAVWTGESGLMGNVSFKARGKTRQWLSWFMLYHG